MRRSAFTLIELLVIVAVIGIMTTGAILAVAAGQKAVRVKGATRDVFAAIRQARSVALVTQKPVIVNYATTVEDGEPRAVVEIVSAKLMDTQTDRSSIQTITGYPLKGAAAEPVPEKPAKAGGDEKKEGAGDGGEGKSVEDILFAPVDSEVVTGMRLKVLRGDEYLESRADERPKSKVSVFSNVDYLIGRYKDAKAEADKEKKAAQPEAKGEDAAKAPGEDVGEPVSIVWETNGRVEPHKVWVYPDGARPEDGLCIKVDAFGGAKVLSGDGREE